MFALLEIAPIYKALKRFADSQGPICYNDGGDARELQSRMVPSPPQKKTGSSHLMFHTNWARQPWQSPFKFHEDFGTVTGDRGKNCPTPDRRVGSNDPSKSLR